MCAWLHACSAVCVGVLVVVCVWCSVCVFTVAALICVHVCCVWPIASLRVFSVFVLACASAYEFVCEWLFDCLCVLLVWAV